MATLILKLVEDDTSRHLDFVARLSAPCLEDVDSGPIGNTLIQAGAAKRSVTAILKDITSCQDLAIAYDELTGFDPEAALLVLREAQEQGWTVSLDMQVNTDREDDDIFVLNTRAIVTRKNADLYVLLLRQETISQQDPATTPDYWEDNPDFWELATAYGNGLKEKLGLPKFEFGQARRFFQELAASKVNASLLA
jgi:hypothetical protein